MVTVLLLTVSVAASDLGPLAPGIDLYERGLYANSRASLDKVLDKPGLPEAVYDRARLYLAADYFALQDRRAALYVLEDLARRDPTTAVDPSVFHPNFVALWLEARAEVDKERPPPRDTPPAAVPKEPAKGPAAAGPLPAAAEAAAAPTVASQRTSSRSGPAWKLIALIPVLGAGGFAWWGAYSFNRARAFYDGLTGEAPPMTLMQGQSDALQGQTAKVNAIVAFSGMAVCLAAAVVLALVLPSSSP